MASGTLRGRAALASGSPPRQWQPASPVAARLDVWRPASTLKRRVATVVHGPPTPPPPPPPPPAGRPPPPRRRRHPPPAPHPVTSVARVSQNVTPCHHDHDS